MHTKPFLLGIGSIILLYGCGGGASTTSSVPAGPNSTAVVGVETPSSVAVVTAR
ncbi:MAG: hypothetical protein V4525_14205 [Pseudomonadota bacterium]